jgi:hypothetical protein
VLDQEKLMGRLSQLMSIQRLFKSWPMTCGLLFLAVAGCSRNFIVQGYCSGDEVLAANRVKKWPAKILHTGWEVQGYLGAECDTHMEAWCDAEGNWGISNQISNHVSTHVFLTMIEFGHVENRDVRTFVVISRHLTQTDKVHRNENRLQSAAGTQDEAIRANFESVNCVRPTVVVQDNPLLPISLWNTSNLACTPQQPW